MYEQMKNAPQTKPIYFVQNIQNEYIIFFTIQMPFFKHISYII